MRAISFATVCFTLSLALSALGAEPDIRLAGIVNLPGYKRAVFEDSNFHRSHILAEGQRDGEIEVITISPAELTTTISWFTNQNLKLAIEPKTDQSASPTPTIIL